MKDNDFKTDTNTVITKKFSEKVRTLLIISIFLTGFSTIGGIQFFVRAIQECLWNKMGTNAFAWKLLMNLCMFCTFIFLIKIALDEKPFSNTLSVCLHLIGGLITAASILFPRLPGYQSSTFELFSTSNFVLADGTVLMAGILFFILGSLIQTGFQMQKEMEEIL